MIGSPGMLMVTPQVMLKIPIPFRDVDRLLLLFVPSGLVVVMVLVTTSKSPVQVNTLATISVVGTVAMQVKLMRLKGGLFGKRIDEEDRKTDRLGAKKGKGICGS